MSSSHNNPSASSSNPVEATIIGRVPHSDLRNAYGAFDTQLELIFQKIEKNEDGVFQHIKTTIQDGSKALIKLLKEKQQCETLLPEKNQRAEAVAKEIEQEEKTLGILQAKVDSINDLTKCGLQIILNEDQTKINLEATISKEDAAFFQSLFEEYADIGPDSITNETVITVVALAKENIEDTQKKIAKLQKEAKSIPIQQKTLHEKMIEIKNAIDEKNALITENKQLLERLKSLKTLASDLLNTFYNIHQLHYKDFDDDIEINTKKDTLRDLYNRLNDLLNTDYTDSLNKKSMYTFSTKNRPEQLLIRINILSSIYNDLVNAIKDDKYLLKVSGELSIPRAATISAPLVMETKTIASPTTQPQDAKIVNQSNMAASSSSLTTTSITIAETAPILMSPPLSLSDLAPILDSLGKIKERLAPLYNKKQMEYEIALNSTLEDYENNRKRYEDFANRDRSNLRPDELNNLAQFQSRNEKNLLKQEQKILRMCHILFLIHPISKLVNLLDLFNEQLRALAIIEPEKAKTFMETLLKDPSFIPDNFPSNFIINRDKLADEGAYSSYDSLLTILTDNTTTLFKTLVILLKDSDTLRTEVTTGLNLVLTESQNLEQRLANLIEAAKNSKEKILSIQNKRAESDKEKQEALRIEKEKMLARQKEAQEKAAQLEIERKSKEAELEKEKAANSRALYEFRTQSLNDLLIHLRAVSLSNPAEQVTQDKLKSTIRTINDALRKREQHEKDSSQLVKEIPAWKISIDSIITQLKLAAQNQSGLGQPVVLETLLAEMEKKLFPPTLSFHIPQTGPYTAPSSTNWNSAAPPKATMSAYPYRGGSDSSSEPPAPIVTGKKSWGQRFKEGWRELIDFFSVILSCCCHLCCGRPFSDDFILDGKPKEITYKNPDYTYLYSTESSTAASTVLMRKSQESTAAGTTHETQPLVKSTSTVSSERSLNRRELQDKFPKVSTIYKFTIPRKIKGQTNKPIPVTRLSIR